MGILYKYLFLLNLLLFSTELLARAGGGGGSGRDSGEGSLLGLIVATLVTMIYQIRRLRLMRKARIQFELANKNDPSWNLSHFKETGSNIFYLYQKAWMEKDLSSVELFFHPRYAKKAKSKMNFHLHGKINVLENVRIKDINLMSVLDVEGKEGDMFVLEFTFMITDYVINEETGEFVDSPLKRKKNESIAKWEKRAQTETDRVIEYWVYYRYKNEWLLYDIHQVNSIVADLKFATPWRLLAILREEENKAYDENIDDSFFYDDAS